MSDRTYFEKLDIHLKKLILLLMPDYDQVLRIVDKKLNLFNEFPFEKKSWSLDFSNARELYVSDIREHFTIYNDYLFNTYTLNGEYHREKGKPAIIHSDKYIGYYMHGMKHSFNDDCVFLSDPAFNDWYTHGDCKRRRYWDKNETRNIDNNKMIKEWYKFGMQHRESEEPAYIHPNGDKIWFFSGKIHRESKNQFAIICKNGYRARYLHGKIHTSNYEPAVIDKGVKAWYYHGEQISKYKAWYYYIKSLFIR